jgi:predicted nucleotidyltransferase component of viral defense system
MIEIIKERVKAIKARSLDDERQALREIIQEVVLLALWRAKFFEHAAFYGGTALRILHGLDRFSEDLDFTLLGARPDFALGSYGTAVKDELAAMGLDVTIHVKGKTSAVESAFIKANTLQHLLKVASPFRTHKGEVLNVKLEIDTDPALGFETEAHQRFWPVLHSVIACNLPSLFAGKLHATLCRERVVNVKGRDWYDFLWYIGRDTPINLVYLENKLRQTGAWKSASDLRLENVKELLRARIDSLDIEGAKRDVARFIKDTRQLDAWTKQALLAGVERLKGQDK